jgi:hypothetical protein
MQQQHNLGCVIITNSDDLHFLRAGLVQIAPIFKDIVISIGTKLWNGEPDDDKAIDAFIKETTDLYTNVRFVRYNVPGDAMKIFSGQVSPEMYWEGHARWVAYESMATNIRYVMFLDSDEIVDGAAFQSWLDTGVYKTYSAMKLRNYWYWRSPTLRAVDYYEDSVVFIKNHFFNPMYLFSNLGRHAIFENCTGVTARDVPGNDNTPMVHHYSWVRTKDQMMRKVNAWGHRSDRQDWPRLVEEEFSRPFNGTDFLKKLKYDITPNNYGIDGVDAS